MDFTVIPEILTNYNFENERPRNLRQMGVVLKVTYEMLEHPLLKSYQGHDPIDPFLDKLDSEYCKRFNRTIIERTIAQASYFSQIDLENGVLMMKSKGIELSIDIVYTFLLAGCFPGRVTGKALFTGF